MSEKSGMPKRVGKKRKKSKSTNDQPNLKDLLRATKKKKTNSAKSSSQEGSEPPPLPAGAQPVQNSKSPQTRRGAQKWDDYFMAVAFLSKLRSKDPNTQVGACIVNNDKQIVAIGYNGLPIGCSNDDFPWGRKGGQEKYPYTYICHAEMNAIVNRTSTSYNLKGCTIYTTLSPCVECAKLIIRSGIEKVVWAEEFREAPKTMDLVERTRAYTPSFEYRQYVPNMKAIKIDLKSLSESPSPVAGEEIHEEKTEESGAQVEKRSAELILKWEDYHMALASLLSWPFHDGNTVADHDRMGACIVNEERRIVGTGSASLPNPCGNDPWAVKGAESDVGHKNVCHAVMNAILNRTVASLKGCTVYSTIFPCNECAKLIIQSGIQNVVFAKLKENKDTERLLYHAGVCHRQYDAWPSVYKKKTKILMDLTNAKTSKLACRMVESD